MAFDIDPKVIKCLSDGDQSAFRAVFEHYYPRVSEFVRRIVKSESAAEDITQDIFIKIWERREIFGVEVQSFGKYIYVMSRNAAINALRRTGRITPLSNESLSKSDSTSIEESYYAQEKELIIRLAVCQMPEQRRRIFEMSRYMGMDNQTIATTLNLSKKTVENHLTLALKTLRSILAVWASLFIAGGGF
ncbi:MAG: RNA polymerase sigma-70 factor [Alistipes sp.]|nr:RNA polymerase sigma-70 factor [Alistipes sp.]